MIESTEKIDEILYHLGDQINTSCSAYLIGGAAFMLLGLKDKTRDIDLCSDLQTVNYIVTELRESDNLWSCSIGHDQFLFLQVFINDSKNPASNIDRQSKFEGVTVELFCNNEYKLLEDRPYKTTKYGNLEVRLPDAKGLIKLKDKQMKRLLEELGRERCMRRMEPE